MKMSQGSTNVIVWEWMNEFGRWRPYDPHVTQFIENSYQNGPHSQQINLGGADSSLSSYAVDFVTTCQIRLGTGTARPIRRSTYPQSSPAGKGIVWQWESDVYGQWHMYDMEVACVLEDHHSQNPQMTNLDLSTSSLKIPYYIDFSRMRQTRIETGRVRKIRRVTTKQAYPCNSSSPVTSSSTLGVSNTSTSPSKRGSSTNVISPAKKVKSGHNFVHSGHNSASSQGNSINNGACSLTGNMTGSPLVNQPSSPARRITRSVVNGQVQPNSNQTSTISMPNQAAFQFQSSSVQQGSVPNHYLNMVQPNVQPFPNFQHNSGASHQQYMHPMIPSSIPSSMTMNSGPSNFTYPSGFMSVPYGMIPQVGMGSLNMSQNMQNAHLVGPSTMNPMTMGNTVKRAGTLHLDIPEEAKIPNNVPKQNKKGKMSDTEMFEQFTEVLQQPPKDEDCCICCEKLNNASGYGEGQMENHVVYQLNRCSHMFHKLCLIAMYESGSKTGSMQCPTCKTIYGIKHGNCPRGVMEYSMLPKPLPGYSDCQTIRILYQISPGIQTQEHPHPGKRFSCRGFPRVCFLPDNDEGRKILKLLIVAWRRRLTFTIGQSTTTGESDTVTWNEIHHKTEFGSNISGHGFPDDKYFDNVLQELSVQGVTEKDL